MPPSTTPPLNSALPPGVDEPVDLGPRRPPELGARPLGVERIRGGGRSVSRGRNRVEDQVGQGVSVDGPLRPDPGAAPVAEITARTGASRLAAAFDDRGPVEVVALQRDVAAPGVGPGRGGASHGIDEDAGPRCPVARVGRRRPPEHHACRAGTLAHARRRRPHEAGAGAAIRRLHAGRSPGASADGGRARGRQRAVEEALVRLAAGITVGLGPVAGDDQPLAARIGVDEALAGRTAGGGLSVKGGVDLRAPQLGPRQVVVRGRSTRVVARIRRRDGGVAVPVRGLVAVAGGIVPARARADVLPRMVDPHDRPHAGSPLPVRCRRPSGEHRRRVRVAGRRRAATARILDRLRHERAAVVVDDRRVVPAPELRPSTSSLPSPLPQP